MLQRTLLCHLLLSLVWAPSLLAFEQPLQAVFQTELVFPQARHELQLTVAPHMRATDAQYQLTFPVGIEYGLTDTWQMGLGWDTFTYARPKGGATTSGIGDLTLSTKYAFMHLNQSNAHAALAFELGLPIASVNKGHSEGLMTYTPSIILAGEAPALQSAQIFTQAAVSFTQRLRSPSSGVEPSKAYTFQWSSGFFVPYGWLRLTTELTWANNRWNQGGDTNALSVTPGLVFDLPGEWEIGVAAPVGLSTDADNFGVIGHLIYSLAR
jgi:hypothetical protein